MKLVCSSYETEQGPMVAVCDPDLLGKRFENSEIQLEINEEFYGSEKKDAEDVKSVLASASIANLVGENAVEIGVEAGVIDEENVLYVDGVAHAQMVRM